MGIQRDKDAALGAHAAALASPEKSRDLVRESLESFLFPRVSLSLSLSLSLSRIRFLRSSRQTRQQRKFDVTFSQARHTDTSVNQEARGRARRVLDSLSGGEKPAN